MKATAIKRTNTLQVVKTAKKFKFKLPEDLQCAKPTEVRGIRRDEVKLMVSKVHSDEIEHQVFKNIDQFLEEGDVLVVNASGTLKAALEAFLVDGKRVKVHFSTKIEEHLWTVEIREIVNGSTKRFDQNLEGETLALKHGGSLELIEPYYQIRHKKHLKLWKARINIPIPVEEYLDYYGMPIKYNYIRDAYPQSYYQTVFATEMGSAEMPSAGRAFTPELITKLTAKGVQIVPIILHTGVASLELNERPYDEYFKVSQTTADALNLAQENGRRVIAVGTTAIRAIESASDQNGKVKAKEGWTDLYITPNRGLFVTDALLTGFHEPEASHLMMLEALTGRNHLEITYQKALENKYQWHEFGDLHLILP
jgi:S-adenosylmethionine:tRNA ribosyltransferase-isomerase